MSFTPSGKATESDEISIVVPGRLQLRGGSALRGLIGLLLAACIFAAAFVCQSTYGGAAKQIIAGWAPRLVSTSSLPPNNPELAAQSSPSSPQMVAAEPMPPPPSAQTARQELGPTAPLSPELAQKLHTMASALANAEHEIEQLKTSQEQTARDNASAIEQLKASQEQTARDNAESGEQLKTTREQMVNFIAALSEQNLQPKTTAPRSRPTDASTRKPPKQPSPQARVQP
jgi:hypothetical protein